MFKDLLKKGSEKLFGDDPLGKVGSAILGGAENAIGQKAEDFSGKVLGIPSPGKQARNFMDDAYPGTNPWERLGAQGGAQGVAAQGQRSERQMQSKLISHQKNLQRQELQTRRDVANVQAKAQMYSADKTASGSVISSGVNVGPDAVRGGLAALTGRSIGEWKTAVSAMTKRLPSEIQKNTAQASHFFQQSRSARDKLRSEISVLNSQAQKNVADYAVSLATGDIQRANALYAQMQARANVDKTRLGFLAPVKNALDSGLRISDFFDSGELNSLQSQAESSGDWPSVAAGILGVVGALVAARFRLPKGRPKGKSQARQMADQVGKK